MMEWTKYTFGNGAESSDGGTLLFNESFGGWELFDSNWEVVETYAYPQYSLQEAIVKATAYLNETQKVEQLDFRKFSPKFMSFLRGGWKYNFDLRWAAHNYALHYAGQESNFEKSYNEEFEYAFRHGEAKDWALNNMDPSDFPTEFVNIEQIEIQDPTDYASMSWNAIAGYD